MRKKIALITVGEIVHTKNGWFVTLSYRRREIRNWRGVKDETGQMLQKAITLARDLGYDDMRCEWLRRL